MLGASEAMRQVEMLLRRAANIDSSLLFTGETGVGKEVAANFVHRISTRAKDPKVRADAAARAALLTPMAKAYSTDVGNEVAYLGVQVHGGMGFIEETGAAQHYRDARITAIYEGTNGIQAIDLVTRKLAANGGASVWALLSELAATVKQVEASNDPAFGTTGAKLREALKPLVGDLQRVVYTSYANPTLSDAGAPCPGGRAGFDIHPSFNLEPQRLAVLRGMSSSVLPM